ncbi:hypothetical protein ACFOTA_05675 [Chitinophaga sp. GCM10012297]|uniref:Uncharacterized protein n=1 Tax=Chitinophaga chungangae TaxID=2821488 RepID=A0ABS3YAI1_9BACT|nr:hypothetical protein [Chitinophaga chungangae]MBO9151686.1 hypothetical protein [Chitinophaga chungangae]
MEDLKAAWQNMGAGHKSPEELKTYLRKMPVRRNVLFQMIMETSLFVLFLAFYYDAFDGHQKPFYLNLLLCGAFGFIVLHNIAGIVQAMNVLKGKHLRGVLAAYSSRLKVFAAISVASRAAMYICFMLFFTYAVEMNTFKVWVLIGAALVFLGQMVWLVRIWLKRIAVIDGARFAGE